MAKTLKTHFVAHNSISDTLLFVANDTMVSCLSFFSCAVVSSGNSALFAARKNM